MNLLASFLKGTYRCAGPGIRYFSGQFFPGHYKVLGGKFCPGIRFLAIFDKKCLIFDKRVRKVTYLPKNSNFGTLKFMKTCLVIIRFLGTFRLGIRFLGEILPGLGVALAAHPYLPLLGSPPLPPPSPWSNGSLHIFIGNSISKFISKQYDYSRALHIRNHFLTLSPKPLSLEHSVVYQFYSRTCKCELISKTQN